MTCLFHHPADSFADSGHVAAAVVRRTGPVTFHAGVLFSEKGAVRALHLGWENLLLLDPWRPTAAAAQVWAVPDFDEARLRLVGSNCRLVWSAFQKEGCLPYGIEFDGAFFRSTTGELVLGGRAAGLSCATFVVAVFRMAGIELVDIDTWEVRTAEDEVWLEAIRLQLPTDDPALVRVECEVTSGVRRVRPTEVVGACVCDLPANFSAARAAADQVEARL